MDTAGSPLKATGVQSDLHQHGAACVQVAALDGYPGAARQRPGGRVDPVEVGRLWRDTETGARGVQGEI